MRRLLQLCLLAVPCVLAAPLRAHDPGLSELEVSVEAGRVEVEWSIDPADLLGQEPEAGSALELEVDGVRLAPERAELGSSWDGHRRLRLAWSAGPRDSLRLTAALLERLPLGHRVLARVSLADGRTAAQQMLSARRPSLEHRMARP